jgi:hypothetical protein
VCGQLLKDVSNCIAFSLQFDESTDTRDTVQLLVFIQMVFKISASKKGGDEKAELEDEEWLFYLTFLADFTGKLNDTNLELQGKTNALLR